ncbi:heavy metal translocating P-type ATPase [Lottiidibacillus patelloidae]|uniref:Cd(2+)-exporting ATPase n=1 Tax=Lottiidibacillus patelloidae TaxID=2670334 RepID=A0A263BWK3_9BACI|nr:cation-translocating P-type ATPase [Lottiidibacillus patelloidae]OZM58040.1 heavy metal translocating P-type ATPase [Lottiidibacillus patelloidae]
MKEHKLQGLSCANCAADIEKQIKQLDHGDSAAVLFNSSKLKIDEKVNMQKVEQILANDGASIVKESGNEEHSHNHDYGSNMKLLLIISTALFILTMFLSKYIPSWAEIALYIVSITISGYSTFIRGAKNLIKLKFNIDTLMTVALIGAIAIGEWKEATVVAILFGLNEFLEGLGMEKARRSMEKLLQVAPKEAVLIDNGQEKIVPIKELKKGDIVLVKAGEKIPSDGVVLEGKSSVNEAAITGESLPVEKEIGENVFGGSINNEGVLKVKITKAFVDSSLAKILHLVEEAQETKTPTELFINRFAKYYTPLVMIIAVIVMFIPPLFLSGDWQTWIYQGLAVLIVGCPCALILSSPIAIVAGITRNARNGILVKGGVFLEQLGKISVIAFDKTGTLTKGEPYVSTVVEYEENFLEIAASIESTSSHPLAKAIMKKVKQEGIIFSEAEEIETISGQGIVAKINEQRYFIGNEKTIVHINPTNVVQEDINRLKEAGFTLVIVSDEKKVLGIIGITDEIRQESREVIFGLHQAGIKDTVMLTGDHHKTAKNVADSVGVKTFFTNQLPEQKVEKIKELRQHETVAMVGDGINDAPALAVADLGIAMGKGTDSAIETADIVLMQDHLGKLPNAIKIAKRMNKIIKFNISISLGLKVIALLLTIPGWLTLWIAILADMGATIFVTLVSLSLLISKKEKESSY